MCDTRNVDTSGVNSNGCGGSVAVVRWTPCAMRLARDRTDRCNLARAFQTRTPHVAYSTTQKGLNQMYLEVNWWLSLYIGVRLRGSWTVLGEMVFRIVYIVQVEGWFLPVWCAAPGERLSCGCSSRNCKCCWENVDLLYLPNFRNGEAVGGVLSLPLAGGAKPAFCFLAWSIVDGPSYVCVCSKPQKNAFVYR